MSERAFAEQTYPIPIARFDGVNNSTLVCPECHRERQATEEEIGIGEPGEAGINCDHGCLHTCLNGRQIPAGLEWKYQEAPSCATCKTLGWHAQNVADRFCSRRCQLQGEYADQLAARKATDV